MNLNLKNLAFLILIWGILNLTNGVIIFNHDILGTLTNNYYIIVGSIRAIIGINTLIIAWYIWTTADKIVIFENTKK